MSRPFNISNTLTFVPNGNTGTTNLSASSSNPSSNGNTSHTSTTYASFTTQTTAGYTYYTFPVSGIPENASISSVSCIAKIRINNTSRVSNTNIQLYSGTTAKGTSKTFSSTSTSNTVTLNDATWTVSEINNARLRFGGKKASSNNNGYIYFYGATLSVTYVLQGTEYEITSTLATDAVDSIDPAGQTYVVEGNDYELSIYADSIDNFIVEDNGVDVTNSLVRHTSQPGNFTFTGIPTSFDYTNSIYDTTSGTNGVYDTNYIDNGLTDYTSSTRAAIYAVQGSNADTYIYYNFDCSSIPNNAIITSVSCQVKAGNQGTSYYSSNYRQVQLCSGTTTKGTSQNITGSNTSPTTVTVNGGSSWTREELNDVKIRYWVRRGTSSTTTGSTISFYGATLTINYTVTSENPYYWTYSLSNISADHTIIISDAIIEIPEEDPQYNYYPITISSINATTEPGRGTTRVIEGTNQTITIYPDDPSIALVTDNGVDITNQLVAHGGTIPTPTVSTPAAADYQFTLNNSTGYYVSQNTEISKSAALCRVDFNFPVRCLVTIDFINYAEQGYDFGVFGNLDADLSGDYYAAGGSGATITDTNYKLACNSSTYNKSSVQTITYEVPSGEHYINIKYSKDDASDSNNDTLQWKISNIEPLEANNYYTYTLSNVQEAHSLIFIFGDVTYYFVNSSGTNAKLFPSGSMVQLPGDYYTLTIVPDDYSYNVTVTDNNVDVTSQVQRKEEQITKEGNTYTVVNYIYKLNNIQATHNITINCLPNIALYIKINNKWIKTTKVYKKISGFWVEQNDFTDLFDSDKVYITH